MKEIYQSTLFDKRILVAERDAEPEQDAFAVVYALAELFSIRIVSGEELAQRRMLRFAAEQLGKEVPEPFYRGFPESVKSLTADQRLLDQIVHYTVTYGFGLFGRAGHSLLERSWRERSSRRRPSRRTLRSSPRTKPRRFFAGAQRICCRAPAP